MHAHTHTPHARRCTLTKEVVVGISLVLEGESAVADVIEVLEPLKVRHSHTTCIGIQVLNGVGGGEWERGEEWESEGGQNR